MGRGKLTTQEALGAQPTPTPTCPVARVLGSRGQHLHEVSVARSLVDDKVAARLDPDGRDCFTTLAELPPRFRSVLWVKRGGYVLVDLSEQRTDKIGGEIAMVLLPAHIKQLRQAGRWPAQYSSKPGSQGSDNDDSDHSNSDPLLRANPNRRRAAEDESSDSDSE
ncbi:hypothetical protein GGF46_004963 [Coemansia sp. RSA 552]|nr:hypothetical protein GGF46_004963 [Coemansia sp. RSA 552]